MYHMGLSLSQKQKKIKSDDSLSHIPVIFMSAKVQSHEVEQYIEAGAVGVIQKPFDPMTLPSEIKSILNHDD